MEMEKKNEKVLTENVKQNQQTKKEPIYRGIKAMPFVIGNETFEKLGTIGTSANLLVYLTSIFHLRTITATNLNNIFSGTCNFGTLIGAYLSDTYFGRYKTIAFASVASFLGMLVLTLTAGISNLHPPSCSENGTCKSATAGQLTFLLSGFGLLIIGASGIRPCNLAIGADQFNPNTEAGRKGINSFFNWYYFTYTFAVMVSMTGIVYVQASVSWTLGLAIPTLLMFLSCACFFAGSKILVKVLPEGSPLTGVAQVIVAAYKKRGLPLPEDPIQSLFSGVSDDSKIPKIPHTDQFRFLDKAAIVTKEDKLDSEGLAVNPWRISTIQQVEEVKCLLRLVPIWVSGMVYSIALTEFGNYLVFQALQSDRRVGSSGFKIPAATFSVFSMLAATIWIPVYDRLIVPSLQKITRKEGGITLLQRMGIGIVLVTLTMILSGLVELQRRTVANTRPTLGDDSRKGAISSMSAMWFVPQLALLGLAEAFFYIGQSELFYKQSPENMKSLSSSVVYCGLGAASYLSSFLSSVVQSVTSRGGKNGWLAEDLNVGKLDNFYYLIGGLQALNFVYFLVCANWYKYKVTGGGELLEVGMEKVDSKKGHV
jgi:peptide/histidine transporter 3/4